MVLLFRVRWWWSVPALCLLLTAAIVATRLFFYRDTLEHFEFSDNMDGRNLKTTASNITSSDTTRTTLQHDHLNVSAHGAITTDHPAITVNKRNCTRPRVLVHVPRKCRVAPWEQPDTPYSITTDTESYFSSNGSWACFTEGTSQNNGSHCQCRDNWHGDSCSIPAAVWYSDLNLWKTYKASRIKPRFFKHRRIIQAFSFNMEFDMLDARFDELGDVVEVFLILESNYTAFGKPKPLYLLNSLNNGYYNRTSCKIVHVFLDYFPTEALKDGWIADRLHRDYISSHGLVKQLAGYKDDDVFLLTDADEIPSREVLLFLKLHDGYPEPVGLFYQSSIYGFFWQNKGMLDSIACATSVGVMSQILTLKAYNIRQGAKQLEKRQQQIKQYLDTNENPPEIRVWLIGDKHRPGGWHCSYCLSSRGIRNKLLSQQNGDYPRWGNYPEKIDLKYLEAVIKNGSWFDNKRVFEKRRISPETVPKYFLNNFETYKYLLLIPYTT